MTDAIPRDLGLATPQLRPLLRGRWHIEMPRLHAELENVHYDGHLASMPFSQDAVVLLGYDLPDRTLQVGPDCLASWNITFQQALKLAMQNLRALSAPRFRNLEGGVLVGDWSDGYDTSRILLPEVMRECGIQDELILMVPSRRGGILAAPAASPGAQLRMLGHAYQFIEEQGGIISAAMYRYQDRRITTYLPTDEQLLTKLNDLQKLAASSLYAEQKEMLDKRHSRRGEDIFVASYQVGQRAGGWLSACSWTRGLTSMLPKTDVVSMVALDPSGADKPRVKVLRWDAMQSLAGERLRPTDSFPPRFLVSDFPSDAELARAPAAFG